MCVTYQAEKAYFVDSDYRDKTIYSVWYLIITIKMWRAGLKCIQVPAYMGTVSCFIKYCLSHPSHPLVCIILKLNLIPNSQFGKKMTHVKSCHFLSMFGSSSDCCLHLSPWQASWSYHKTFTYFLATLLFEKFGYAEHFINGMNLMYISNVLIKVQFFIKGDP